MRLIGNVLWLVLAGWWLCLGYLLAGVANCLTVIGIPFGIASFRLAGYTLWPFGRAVVGGSTVGGLTVIANVIWFFLGGIWLALGHLLAGVLLCVTVLGIPFGLASFRMAGLALAPLGKHVVPAGSASAAHLAGPVVRPLRT